MPFPARGRRRSCPCCQLTLSVTGTSQPTQVYDIHGRLAFRYQRARFDHVRFAKAWFQANHFRFAMTYRAGRRGKMVAICKDPCHCDPRVETLRSASVGQPSRQPVLFCPFTGCHAVCFPPSACHFASDKDKVSVTILAGWRRLLSHAVARVRQGVPGSMSGVSHRNCDETHQTFHPGHQPSLLAGRRLLAALAVSGCRSLLAARHAAGAVLVSVRSAHRVPAAVAVVAAVRVQLPVHHRLGAAASPPAAGLSRWSVDQ